MLYKIFFWALFVFHNVTDFPLLYEFYRISLGRWIEEGRRLGKHIASSEHTAFMWKKWISNNLSPVFFFLSSTKIFICFRWFLWKYHHSESAAIKFGFLIISLMHRNAWVLKRYASTMWGAFRAFQHEWNMIRRNLLKEKSRRIQSNLKIEMMNEEDSIPLADYATLSPKPE